MTVLSFMSHRKTAIGFGEPFSISARLADETPRFRKIGNSQRSQLVHVKISLRLRGNVNSGFCLSSGLQGRN
jgi:hypothetical protein